MEYLCGCYHQSYQKKQLTPIIYDPVLIFIMPLGLSCACNAIISMSAYEYTTQSKKIKRVIARPVHNMSQSPFPKGELLSFKKAINVKHIVINPMLETKDIWSI